MNLLLLRKRRRRINRKHRFWIKDIFRESIKQKSEFNLFLEMYYDDHETFHHCFRTSPSNFDFLLSKVGICLNSIVPKFLQSAVV